MARIVLDTDVVSLYRVGRLPVGFASQVVTNDISHRGLPLLTLDRRDFADFAEHDGLVLLDG